jgi:hypothetical protein
MTKPPPKQTEDHASAPAVRKIPEHPCGTTPPESLPLASTRQLPAPSTDPTPTDAEFLSWLEELL